MNGSQYKNRYPAPTVAAKAAAFQAMMLVDDPILDPVERIRVVVSRVSTMSYPSPAREGRAASLLRTFGIRARLLLEAWDFPALSDEIEALERRARMLAAPAGPAGPAAKESSAIIASHAEVEEESLCRNRQRSKKVHGHKPPGAVAT
jgi:hypothetical protein